MLAASKWMLEWDGDTLFMKFSASSLILCLHELRRVIDFSGLISILVTAGGSIKVCWVWGEGEATIGGEASALLN